MLSCFKWQCKTLWASSLIICFSCNRKTLSFFHYRNPPRNPVFKLFHVTVFSVAIKSPRQIQLLKSRRSRQTSAFRGDENEPCELKADSDRSQKKMQQTLWYLPPLQSTTTPSRVNCGKHSPQTLCPQTASGYSEQEATWHGSYRQSTLVKLLGQSNSEVQRVEGEWGQHLWAKDELKANKKKTTTLHHVWQTLVKCT